MPDRKKSKKSGKSRLVDLFTYNVELEDLIISEYPEKFFDEQHHVDTSEKEQRLYCFYNLSYQTLRKFLEGKNYEYELRDSETGDFVFINKISLPIGPICLN